MTVHATLDSLVARISDNPRALAQFGRALLVKGDGARAATLAPADAEVCGIVAEVLSSGVPDRHFNLVRDDRTVSGAHDRQTLRVWADIR